MTKPFWLNTGVTEFTEAQIRNHKSPIRNHKSIRHWRRENVVMTKAFWLNTGGTEFTEAVLA
jgi:hypothetical protein